MPVVVRQYSLPGAEKCRYCHRHHGEKQNFGKECSNNPKRIMESRLLCILFFLRFLLSFLSVFLYLSYPIEKFLFDSHSINTEKLIL